MTTDDRYYREKVFRRNKLKEDWFQHALITQTCVYLITILDLNFFFYHDFLIF